MSRFLDAQDLPIGIAAFLAYDDYDHIDEPNHISATSLLRPTRQLVLSKRLTQEQRLFSLYDRVKARMGQALHTGIEDVWVNHKDEALAALGIPEQKRNMVVVNPEGKVEPGMIPIYMEKRSFKKVGNYTVSGKFDFIFDGQLTDFKSTGTFTYVNQSKSEDYINQGSIYRWLNPEIITNPYMAINYIFTDWVAFKVGTENYPTKPVVAQHFELKDLFQTENNIRMKLNELEHYDQANDNRIPACTDKELWMDKSTWKYYTNPAKRIRATKNFTSYPDAVAYQQSRGGKGIIVEHKAEPKACNYCPASAICGQYKSFVDQGVIKV